MPLELLHTNHSDYLEVHIQGTRRSGHELEEATAIWAQVFHLSEKYQQNNIMAHVRARGRFPVTARVDFAFGFKKTGCTLNHRIAALAYSNEFFINATLVERYVREEGYNARLFKSREKARRWLLQEKKKFSLMDLFDSFK